MWRVKSQNIDGFTLLNAVYRTERMYGKTRTKFYKQGEKEGMKITNMIFKVADWLLITYVYVSNALADWKRKRKK